MFNKVFLELLVVNRQLIELILHAIDEISLMVEPLIHLSNLVSLFFLLISDSLSLLLQVPVAGPSRSY